MADNENFNRIMAGLGEVAEIVEGKVAPARVFAPAEIDVRAVRKRVGLSQDAFAARFGFSAATVRQWEQGRRRPEASARVLLTVIDREPEAVERALVEAAPAPRHGPDHYVTPEPRKAPTAPSVGLGVPIYKRTDFRPNPKTGKR